MLKSEKKTDATGSPADRRQYQRASIRSVAYIEMDDDNTGLIMNISQGGIGIQSAEMITGDSFGRMLLRLPKSEKWIEAGGKLAWISPSCKEAGIEFVNLSDDAREQIQNWIYSSSFRSGVPVDQGHFKIVWESQEPQISPVAPPAKDELANIEAMFPSEKTVPPMRHSGVDNTSTPEIPRVELGIAPGPVKRQVGTAPAESAVNGLTSAPNLAPSPQPPAEKPQPPAPVRRSYHYPPPPSLPSTQVSDPFAAVAEERSTVRPPAAAVSSVIESAPPITATADAPIVPAFPVREYYRGLGYKPTPFEEPSGRGWLVAALILVVLLAVGTVMALGPDNVKAILGRHLSSISADGPPPPTGATDKTAEAPIAASDNTTSSAPFGGAPPQPLTNPGTGAAQQTTAGAPPAQAPPAIEAPPTTTTVTGRIVPKATVDVDPGYSVDHNLDVSGAVPPGETQGDAAAVTRRFQMEHSGAIPGGMSNSYKPNPPPPQARAASPSVNPGASNPSSSSAPVPQRSFDDYTQASTPVPTTNNSASSNASSAGTVAVSSRFRSLRGEDPAATQERDGVAVGQLLSIRQPVYPIEAERSRTEGVVRLRATVDQFGKVEIVHAVSGPPLLLAAAVDAVREWRYAPTTVNGKAVESVNDVNVVFRLGNSAASPR